MESTVSFSRFMNLRILLYTLFGWIQSRNDVVYDMPENIKKFNNKVILSALGYDFRQLGFKN